VTTDALSSRGALDVPMHATDEYLDAFMNGFEFVLLAIRGRLQVEELSKEDRARLELFLKEYWRIAEAYRNRRPAADEARLQIEGRLSAALEPVMTN
jgi:hypothetical protein